MTKQSSVVADYFAKANVDATLENVTVSETLTSRTVTAEASTTTDPLFIHLFGINEMTSPANGTAQESVNRVEISLVLDISGSMGWDSSEHGDSYVSPGRLARALLTGLTSQQIANGPAG